MKANLIMQYCTMNKEKESTLDLYLRFKRNQEMAKRHSLLASKGGVVKKEVYERHFLSQVEGVNANVVNKINKINKSSRDKVAKYINNRVMSNPSMANHLC